MFIDDPPASVPAHAEVYSLCHHLRQHGTPHAVAACQDDTASVPRLPALQRHVVKVITCCRGNTSW